MHPSVYVESLKRRSAGETAGLQADSEAMAAEEPTFNTDADASVFGLVELILKNRARLDLMIRDPSLQMELLPRFLGIALAGFIVFGVSLALVSSAAGVWPELTPIAEWLQARTGGLITFAPRDESAGWANNPWLNGAVLQLIAAYSFGLIAATGICLPSLYFYGLLSGVEMSLLDVTMHALKSKATSAIALVGILPLYAALSLAIAIFELPAGLVHAVLWLGLILPFLAGLWGVRSLFVGFVGLAETMPPEKRCRRECFLRRLVFSWAAVYTAVSPVMIFTLWEYLAR